MSEYSDLILAHSGLVGYWRLGEGSAAEGGANDAGPNNLDGGYPASGITYSVAGAIANDANTAITADGSSEPVTVLDDNLLDFGDGPLSYELWVKRSATQGATQGLVSKGGGAGLLRFLVNNTIGFSKQGTAGEIVSSSSAITDTTTWHHVVVTKNGSSSALYVDGVDAGVAGTNQTLTDTTVGLRIGHVATAQRFPGSLDEVAVYSAVLTAAEVLEHYEVGSGVIKLDGASAGV
jgi:hypothetical protein